MRGSRGHPLACAALLTLLLSCSGGSAGSDVTAPPADTDARDAAVTDVRPDADAGQPRDSLADATPDAALADGTDRDAPGDSDAGSDGGDGSTDAVPDVSTGDGEDADSGAPETPLRPFLEGPYGTGFREIAGPFSVPTLAGDWDFRATWTGRDSYAFLQYSDDPGQSAELRQYLEDTWHPLVCEGTDRACGGDGDCGGGGGSCRRDAGAALRRLLVASPRAVHFVISSFDADARADVEELAAAAETALAGLPATDRDHWRARLHFVTVPVWQAGGWLGDVFAQTGWLWFGVDSFQRMRQFGLVLDIVRDAPDLTFVSRELVYFAFEAARHDRMEAETDVTTVPVFAAERVHTTTVDVQLPPAVEMATFDGLEIDASFFCPGHIDENCGEWDYLAHLWVCERPLVAENPHADTPCQPAVTGDDPIPADTLPCQCETPLGAVVDRTHVCNADGSGYGACGCACDTEMARWVTTYRREGRWVTDVSDMLALLRSGGTQRLRLNAGNPYDVDLALRFLRRGSGLHPAEARPLFHGGAFDLHYNEGREPVAFTVPEGVERVRLVAWITGHGFGVERANCAEFCNHTHHFEVNGVEFVKSHPEAGLAYGCYFQVPQGVVPNQYGTWPYGRGGWCPGFDVKPWVVDVTDALVPGENTITYQGLLNGSPYVPQPVENPAGGFGARIDLTSYLVYWRP